MNTLWETIKNNFFPTTEEFTVGYEYTTPLDYERNIKTTWVPSLNLTIDTLGCVDAQNKEPWFFAEEHRKKREAEMRTFGTPDKEIYEYLEAIRPVKVMLKKSVINQAKHQFNLKSKIDNLCFELTAQQKVMKALI